MPKKVIINGKLILDDGVLEGHDLFFDTQITGIAKAIGVYDDMVVIDAKGAFVCPGFFDIHVHGMAGYDTMDATFEALEGISKALVKHGVTSFLATTVTDDPILLKKAIDNVRQNGTRVSGALCLGIHLEGPFIHPLKKGAHNEAFILPPDAALFAEDADVIKLITYAPELDPDQTLIKWSKKSGVKLSLGHSDATYQEAMSAFKAGVYSVTHLFNAMTGLHHREPGVVGAVLNSDVYAELIADNIHVNPSLYPLLYRQKGPKKLMLITDCMRAGGLSPGQYKLGTLTVAVDHEKATLSDGTLAGSILTMNHALKHFVKATGQTLSDVMPMMGKNQANLLAYKSLGTIAVGMDADLVIMDADFKVLSTIVKGSVKV